MVFDFLSTTAGKWTLLACGLLVIYLALRFGRRLVTIRVHDSDARYRVRKVAGFAAFVATVTLALVLFGDSLSGLGLALGAASAGVAFALQEVIASVAGWMAIWSGKFFAVGERVQLGGIVGDVIDIGVLRTTLMECGQWVKGDLYTGRVVRVANSFVFKEPVFNYSGDFRFLWDEVTVPVMYGSDVEYTRAQLFEVVDAITRDYAASAAQAWKGMVSKFRIEDARLTPMVTLVATDNWIEFTVRYVVDFRSRRTTKDLFFF